MRRGWLQRNRRSWNPRTLTGSGGSLFERDDSPKGVPNSALPWLLLAGGGLRTAQAIGTTNELGTEAIDRVVTVPDFHATIHCALGIDPAKNLYAGDRPVPITDNGIPIKELFA